MDCVLKQDIASLLNRAISELEALDAFLAAYYNDTPDYRLNPSQAFMSAWNRIKTARQNLHSINLDEVTT